MPWGLFLWLEIGEKGKAMRSEWLFNYEVGNRGCGQRLRTAADVHEFAKNPNCHIAIVSDTLPSLRNAVEGYRGVIQTADPENPVVYHRARMSLIWPKTGARATMFTYDQPDRIRGLRLDACYC